MTKRRSNNGFVLTCAVVLAGLELMAGFVWTGQIVMTPESGIVETGNSIDMEIIDSFEVTDLPDGEYPISEGSPTYYWYLNGSTTPCKEGRQVTFSTGDENADIETGDFTVEVRGSRTYTIPGCSCGCGDPSCKCQERRGPSSCRGCQQMKTGKTEFPMTQSRDASGTNIRIDNHWLARADGAPTRVIVKFKKFPVTNDMLPLTVIAGSLVELEASLDKTRKEALYRWNVPGTVFANYNENASQNQLRQLSEYDLWSQNLNFYWSNGGNNLEVMSTGVVRGTVLSKRIRFKVLRPIVSVNVNVENGYSMHSYGLCFGTNPYYKGITFSHGNNTNSDISNGGEYCWTQVIRNGRLYAPPSWADVSFSNALDNDFRFKTDNPINNQLYVSFVNHTEVIHHKTADMFLMYKPAGPNVTNPQWIPLKVVKWFANGRAYLDNGWHLDNNNSFSTHPIVEETFIHPEWNSIRYNFNNPHDGRSARDE